MQFALQVPGRGAVAGSLLYYPFENEAETLPMEDTGAQHAHVTTYNLTQARAPGSPVPCALVRRRNLRGQYACVDTLAVKVFCRNVGRTGL